MLGSHHSRQCLKYCVLIVFGYHCYPRRRLVRRDHRQGWGGGATEAYDVSLAPVPVVKVVVMLDVLGVMMGDTIAVVA